MLCADSDLSNIEMEIEAIDVSHSQLYMVGNSEVVETLPKLVPMDKISLLVPVHTTPI